MEQYGNKSTYNLENVLRQNIGNSEYYREQCSRFTSWREIIDEIYYNVTHVEPWLSGNARGASTSFCLLYKLFQMRLSEKQIEEFLNHPDSPYIRAVGFLYLRYVCDPKKLQEWYEPYFEDEEDFFPSGKMGAKVTMGAYVRDLLLNQYYFETIFPRIPKKASDEIIEALRDKRLPTKSLGNGGQGGPDRRGVDESNRRPASVKASLSVAFGQRAPNRAGTREDGYGRDPSFKGYDEKLNRRSPGRSPSRRYRDDSLDRRDRRSSSSPRHRSRRNRSRSLSREYRRSRSPRSPRSRSPLRVRKESHDRRRLPERNVRDVFRDSAQNKMQQNNQGTVYGTTYGTLQDKGRRTDGVREEVYRIGGGWR